jgi:hypothetical protein
VKTQKKLRVARAEKRRLSTQHNALLFKAQQLEQEAELMM